jgi:tRNA threonylcarbamoyladenosine biosynthesis protein TsaB
MSPVLALDCAVSGLGIALVREGRCLARLREEGRDQAARLLPAIGEVLEQAGVARREISLIAITIGPGSFTGVRVGLAAARGLALALELPLAGIATTDVLLAQAKTRDRQVVAVIDSRLGDWFAALDAGDRRPFIASTAQLAERIGGRPATLVGPDVERLAASIPGSLAEQGPIDPIVLARLASAEDAAAWRERNRREGLPRPLYLRGVNVTSPDGTRHTVG